MATRNIIEELPVSDPTAIEEWLERFEQYAAIHDVIVAATTDDIRATRKVALLISCLGAEGYKLVKAYLAPEAPSTKTYAQLTKCITDNLVPKTSRISEAYKLAQMKQESTESLALFMSRVKSAAAKCNYGESYDRMVVDKFVCGIKSEKLRGHLINDATIETSSQALEKALSRESSQDAAHYMSTSVHAVSQYRDQRTKFNPNKKTKSFGFGRSDKNNNNRSSSSSHQNSSPKCSKCTLKGHTAENCRTKCHFCKRTGHIRANCYKLQKKVNRIDEDNLVNSDTSASDESTTAKQNGAGNGAGDLYVYHISESVSDVDTERLEGGELQHDFGKHNFDNINHLDVGGLNVHNYASNYSVLKLLDNINHVKTSSGKHMLNIIINSQHVDMELDTGSPVSCISKADFDRYKFTGCVLSKCDRVLMVANGQSVRTLHKTVVFVKYRDIHRKLSLLIVGSAFPTLLGRDWIVAPCLVKTG